MSSEIRVNSLSSRAGLSTVTFTDTGPIFSGITTFQDNSGFNVGTGGSIFSPASNTVTLGTNSAERLRIASNGNIGIGTDNPLQKLHLLDTTSANIYLQTHNAGTGSTAGVYFRTSDSSTADGFFKTAIVLEDDGTSWARGKLHFLQNNTADASNATLDDSVLTINQSGNIGIGTDNPSYLIDAHTSSGNAQLRVKSGGDLSQLILESTDTSGYSQINFADAGSSNIGMLQYFHSDNHMEFTVNGSEALRITSGGDMGLGTASPTARLDVRRDDTDGKIAEFHQSTGYGIQIRSSESVATIRAEYNQALVFETGTTATERLRITSNGMVRVTDSASLTFGNNDDMRIFHDGGSANYIDVYNKDLYIRCNRDSGIVGGDIVLQPQSGENSAIFRDNGAVELYYNNTKKFETTSAGVDVSGSSDGVLNLDTTDGRGSFIRFKENGTTKAWVGCAEGMGGGTSSPNQDDLGLRASRYILCSAGGAERLRIQNTATAVHVKGESALTGTTGDAKGLSIAVNGANSCPLYFGTETHSAQKSIYLNGYWMYIRGHQNEGIRFVFSQGSGTAPRSDQYQFKYNQATRPTGNTTWDGFSDRRAKENVQDVTSALDTIGRLRPVTFDWTNDYADRMNMFNMDKSDPKSYNWFSVKENGYDESRKNNNVGFIAQEFEEVFPKDITETEMELGDETITDFKTVNFDSLVPMLTKAVQELKAENDSLKARLDAAGL